MMKNTIETNWLGQKGFESNIGAHKIVMDTVIEKEGNNTGPSPLPLLMSSYAGCMGIDTISILTKKQIDVEALKIITEGTLNDEFPHYYKEINTIFQFKGKELPLDIIKDAVDKAENKYCGICATLKNAVKISNKIELIDA